MNTRKFNHLTGKMETVTESGSELQYYENRERFFQLKDELLAYISQKKLPEDYDSKVKELKMLQDYLWPSGQIL